jgi:hypothetical protein
VTTDTIVQILRVGLSGFAFLLAFLSYRLLAAEQAKERPRPHVLRSSRFFLLTCVALVVIVSGFEIVSRLFQPKPTPDALAACRMSLEFLEIKSSNAKQLEDLEDAITDHIRECAQAFPAEEKR